MRDGLVRREQLERMAGRLAHRGPDGKGYYQEGGIGLVHTRLSTIDLTGKQQPFYAENKNLVLVANGEIYNHRELRAEIEAHGIRLATHSDCETILGAYLLYGENKFLSHLRGMFAFALYIKRERRVLLARDRLGIKPLFSTQWPGGFAFASELKALLALNLRPVEVDSGALTQFFENQFTTGRDTIVENMERVQPGEAMCVEDGGVVRRWRYWSPLAVRPRRISFEDAQEELGSIMDTVMRQNMRADMPFGLLLSGGVDSASLLGLLTRYKSGRISTFSAGFPDAPFVDELSRARRMVDLFGSKHTEIRLTAAQILCSLPYTVWAADELILDTANSPTLLLAKAASQENLKIVFTGEASDNIFAGCRHYRTRNFRRWLHGLFGGESRGFQENEAPSDFLRRQLYSDRLRARTRSLQSPFVKAWSETPLDWSDVQRRQYVDLMTELPNKLLAKVDRMLMSWGVEGRVPFADHRIVEFGLSLPDNLKIKGCQGKPMLRRWAANFLPADHVFHRKTGFRVPMAASMQGQFLARMRIVLPQQRAIREWFRPDCVVRLIDSFNTPGIHRGMVLALMQFAIWHRLFVEGSGEAPPVDIDPLDLLAGRAA